MDTRIKKRDLTEEILHELSHQWIGNLVTPESWDDLWLSEGLAVWMFYYASHELAHQKPELRPQNWARFVSRIWQPALEADASRSGHALQRQKEDSSMINLGFDVICYQKGACIIRMWCEMFGKTIFGETVFLTSLRAYLESHKSRSITTDTLVESLTEEPELQEELSFWTKRVGFPLVTVTETGGKITLTQKRFLKTNDLKPDEHDIIFPLRISILTRYREELWAMFLGKKLDLRVKPRDFVKININQTGFFRTAYSIERLKKLEEAGRLHQLSAEDELGILHDVTSLIASGHQGTSALLAACMGMRFSDELTTWEKIIDELEEVRLAWLFQSNSETIAEFGAMILGEKALKIGWKITEHKEIDDEALRLQELKVRIFSAAVGFGHARYLEIWLQRL